MFHGRAYTKERFFVIRTRPKLVSVPNKPSNFSVRSSLRGLQFLVTRRRPPTPPPNPSFSQSFVFPHPFPIPVSFSEPNLPHSFHRCTHGLNTGPPAIVTRGEAESFADRSRAEETLPTFLLLLFVQPSPPPLSLSPLFSPLRHQFFFLPPFSTPLSPSPLRSFLPSPPARSRFTILSGPLPLSPPLSPTFIRGSTAQILLFCFPPALLPPLSFVRALACKAGRGSRVFLPTGYRSPRTGRSKQRNEHSPSSSSLPFGGIKHGSAIFRPTLVEIVDISIKFYSCPCVCFMLLVFHIPFSGMNYGMNYGILKF